MYGDIKIKLEDCKHGHLYRIFSRNLSLGVFDKACSGFVGIRTKFGHRYLFCEFHYDTGAPFGTVNPLEEIEQCPHEPNENNNELFRYLEEQLAKLAQPEAP